MENRLKKLDDLIKIYDDDKHISKLILSIYEKAPQVVLNNTIEKILMDHNIEVNNLDIQYKEDGITIFEHLIKNKENAILANIFMQKKNIKKIKKIIEKPFKLYALMYNFNTLYLTKKQKEKIYENIVDIEKSLLEKNKEANITDFFIPILNEGNNNLLSSSITEDKISNLDFILKNIPNKNFKETTVIRNKKVSNDLLLMTGLIMSGVLTQTSLISEKNLDTIKKFNDLIDTSLITKIISLNIIGLESVFNDKIIINRDKLKNLARSSLCLIEINQNNLEFMMTKEVEQCLSLLGNPKIFSYMIEINDNIDEEQVKFDSLRRGLLNKRMNALLNDNYIDDARKKRKI